LGCDPDFEAGGYLWAGHDAAIMSELAAFFRACCGNTSLLPFFIMSFSFLKHALRA